MISELGFKIKFSQSHRTLGFTNRILILFWFIVRFVSFGAHFTAFAIISFVLNYAGLRLTDEVVKWDMEGRLGQQRQH